MTLCHKCHPVMFISTDSLAAEFQMAEVTCFFLISPLFLRHSPSHPIFFPIYVRLSASLCLSALASCYHATVAKQRQLARKINDFLKPISPDVVYHRGRDRDKDTYNDTDSEVDRHGCNSSADRCQFNCFFLQFVDLSCLLWFFCVSRSLSSA